MKLFSALTARLIVAVSIFFVVAVAGAFVATSQQAGLGDAANQITEQAHPYGREVARATIAAQAAAIDYQDYLLTGDRQFLDSAREVWDPAVFEALKRARSYYPDISIESESIDRVIERYERWVTERDANAERTVPDGTLDTSYQAELDAVGEIASANVRTAGQAFDARLQTARASIIGGAIGLLILVVLLATWIMIRTESEAAAGAFVQRLSDAMDMADTTTDVFQTVGNVLDNVASDASSELLLADSSQAHLAVAANNISVREPMCPVATTWGCPAIRRGRTIVTNDTQSVNSCPRLSEHEQMPASAVCAPVMFMGRALGVLHATKQDSHRWSGSQVDRLNELAIASGNRLGVLSALDQSKRQAATDSLTGLANRRTLDDHVHELARVETPYVVAMGDLDNFKAINDTFGHDAGDRALRRFARVIRENIRDGDLVARYGGDEFVVVFSGGDQDHAVAALERVREQLVLETSDDRIPSFTASFGVCGDDCATNYEDALLCADNALLAAKVAGRNRVLTSAHHGAHATEGTSDVAGHVEV